MIQEVENIEKLDEEFKIRLKEVKSYCSALKWTNYSNYEMFMFLHDFT